MKTPGPPRRRVLDAYKITEWGNSYNCRLSCGHWEVAYGVTPRGGFNQIAPKTVSCRQCGCRP